MEKSTTNSDSDNDISLPGNEKEELSDLEISAPGSDKPGRPKKSLESIQWEVFSYLERCFAAYRDKDLFKEEVDRSTARLAFKKDFNREGNLALLEAWVDNYMSVEGRNRMFIALRKKKHGTKNITVSTATAYKLRSISEQVAISIDEIISIALDDFQKRSLEKHKEYKPIRGEKPIF